MQGLADGYFVIPYTIGGYLANMKNDKINTDSKEFKDAEKEVKNRIKKLLAINGKKTVDEYHRELGHVMWEHVGMSRNEKGLKTAIKKIQEIRADFWKNVKVLGTDEELNQSLEKAGRVADFLELGELMAEDALHRRESCGGHFREESQTDENEALRDDKNFAYVAAWEYTGEGGKPKLNQEKLEFENVQLTQRSYK
jgi:succinate dehydrogenase / fumarate reductase flavoprotein subunit